MRNAAKFKPRKKDLTDIKHYRIISSRYPPVALFETLVDPEELDVLYELESMTNDRIRQEVGDISLVPVAERLVGPGSSPVMAAFTHIGNDSRFTDGSYGVYYAGLSHETAIKETCFHRERFLSMTNEPACDLQMRCYEGKVALPVHDIRSKTYKTFQSENVSTYPLCQAFARNMRTQGSNGLYYASARDCGGECLALFKPIASSPVKQSKHYIYQWDGKHIHRVYEIKTVLSF